MNYLINQPGEPRHTIDEIVHGTLSIQAIRVRGQLRSGEATREELKIVAVHVGIAVEFRVHAGRVGLHGPRAGEACLQVAEVLLVYVTVTVEVRSDRLDRKLNGDPLRTVVSVVRND